MTRRLFSLLPAALTAAPLMPTRSELDRLHQALQKTLLENILGFWYPQTTDPAGGYLLNHDGEGKLKGPGVKMIVSQARMLWFYARMARYGHEPKAMLAAAEHGFAYLRDRMWDAKYGGFIWEIDAAGKPSKTNKHLYGQAFGLYALAEYALASGKKEALAFALKCFENMEKRAHDGVHGGYVEYFLSDWSTPPANEPIYMGGSGAGIKLMNTHLHLMEALTALYRVAKQPVIRERLIELMTIESNAVVRKEYPACTDKYSRDWTPLLDGDFARVSYGHDLENIWLLADAAKVAGVPLSPYLDLFESNFAYCRKFGFDASAGGFYNYGGFNEVASDTTKVWWVQSEALVCALLLYKLTGKTEYFEVFRKTWSFCENHQIDWKNGDWHANVSPAGVPSGDKAQPWKAAYHNGRAMMESMALLDSLKEKAQ